MRPIAWIQEPDNRLNAAIAVVCLVVAIEGIALVGPILRPRDIARQKPQPTQTVVVPRSTEPNAVLVQTSSTKLRTNEATFQVCLAGSPVECPSAQVFVRCGGETLRRWAERECGRYTIEGQPPVREAGGCQRSAVRVRCMPRLP